jgi:hypothetical protein
MMASEEVVSKERIHFGSADVAPNCWLIFLEIDVDVAKNLLHNYAASVVEILIWNLS